MLSEPTNTFQTRLSTSQNHIIQPTADGVDDPFTDGLSTRTQMGNPKTPPSENWDPDPELPTQPKHNPPPRPLSFIFGQNPLTSNSPCRKTPRASRESDAAK